MRCTFLISAMVTPCLLMAGGWPQIPPDVWAIKEDPAKGIRGAVVLEDRMIFRNVMIEHVYRVRILSEPGKAAAELEAFPDKAYDFEGRTVYPDGREVVFNNRKDFQTKTSVKVASRESKRTIVVPPGVSSDCVVEIRWKESAASKPNRLFIDPLPERMGYSHEWRLYNAYPTREMDIEVPTSFPWSYEILPSRSHRPTITEKGGFRIFTLRDLPALEEVPYSLEVTRDYPRFAVYFQPEALRPYAVKGPENYWKGAAWVYFRNAFKDSVRKGSGYERLLKELTTGLPAEPQAKAYQLLLRLQGRIRNSTWPTYEEISARTKKDAEEGIDSEDLEATVRKGFTNSWGMEILYFALLSDAGVQPKIAMAVDRDYRLFHMDSLDVFQFNREMMVVEEPGKPAMWFDPTLRFSEPGLIHPDFQGTPALIVNPKDWTASRTVVPVQSQGLNGTFYAYALDVQEEGLGFKMAASFRGYPDFLERTKYMSLEPKEQDRKLKEDLERNLKNAVFSRVQVRNAQSPKENLTLEAEGQIEQEPQRRRTLFPFPAMPWPLWIPDHWPDTRTDFIVVPYLRSHIATSVFKLPKGYTIGEFTPFDQANRFGKVHWSVLHKPGEDEVKVELKVEVDTLLEKPDTYAEFRTFLGWVQDVCGRSIYLEKTR